MKYANKLTDEELKEIYQLFTDSDATIKELTITRFDDKPPHTRDFSHELGGFS